MPDIREYPLSPLVGLGVVVLRPGAILLIRRGRPPGFGQWSLPGGGQKLGETAEAGARREVWEETRVRIGALQLVAHTDSMHPDPGGRLRYHYTILNFMAPWLEGDPIAASDALAAAFVPFAELDDRALPGRMLEVIDRARRMAG